MANEVAEQVIHVHIPECNIGRVSLSKDGKRFYANVNVGASQLNLSSERVDLSALPTGDKIQLRFTARLMVFDGRTTFAVVDNNIAHELVAPAGFKLVKVTG